MITHLLIDFTSNQKKNERFVSILSKEMGVESLLVEELVEKLLPSPKKSILPKLSDKKTKPVNKPKSSLKK